MSDTRSALHHGLHNVGFVVIHDRPYYPSVEYFMGTTTEVYEEAAAHHNRIIEEQMSEEGLHRTVVILAQVMAIAEIPTDY